MANNDLTILAPRQGQAQSAQVGFGAVVNLDIDSMPGIVRLNNILAKVSSTTVTNQINWFARNPTTTAEVYAIDNAGVVYKSADSGATWAVLSGNITSSAHGGGLAIWKDYLFVPRDASTDVYGPLAGATFTVTIASPGVFTKTAHGLAENDTIIFSTTGALPTGLTAGTLYYIIATGLTADEFEVSTSQGGAAVNTSGTQSGTHKYRAWDLSWKTIDSDVLWHPMLVSKNDNKLYGGAGQYVFSVDEVSGQTFAPGTAGTFTFSQQALDLPSPYRIKCLEELGNYLFLGTWQGANVYDIRIADIFPWDRSSVSFGQPIAINDFGVHAIKNINGSLIVLAGINGSIFKSDGSNAYIIGQLPIDLSGGKYLEWYPGGICHYKNKIFFGTGNGGSTAIAGQGVYSLQQTAEGNILNLEHQNSLLTDGSAASVKISALLPITRDTLLAGFRSDTTYGIDLTTATSYAYSTDYSGYFDTPIYQVGTPKSKRLLTELDILLGKILATGEGVKIQYRTTYNGTYSTIGTFTHDISGTTILGSVFTHFATANLPSLETVQFRVALKGTSTTTPFLKNITLR